MMISTTESGAMLHPLNAKDQNEDNTVPMDKVYPALIESFSIIFLGYLAGK